MRAPDGMKVEPRGRHSVDESDRPDSTTWPTFFSLSAGALPSALRLARASLTMTAHTDPLVPTPGDEAPSFCCGVASAAAVSGVLARSSAIDPDQPLSTARADV